MRLVVSTCIAAMFLAGCGGEEPMPLPAEVDRVLAERCRRCHADPPTEGAPMPLVTWDDLQAPAPSTDDPVYETVERRITSEDFPMPPFRTPEIDAFTDAERQVILDWIDSGAPPAPPPVED